MRFIKPSSLTEQSVILDIRSPEEYASETIGLPHIYLELDKLNPKEFVEKHQISTDETINILCASGGRASIAAKMFEHSGFNNVAVIIGGIVEAEYEGVSVIKH